MSVNDIDDGNVSETVTTFDDVNFRYLHNNDLSIYMYLLIYIHVDVFIFSTHLCLSVLSPILSVL